jgi:hypothetical protein
VGTGLIGTVAGVTAFLFFLLFAVQVTVTLYATSTTNAAGYDAARSVAASSIDHDDAGAVRRATGTADQQFRALLGRRGDDAELRWDIDDDAVRLHVVVEAPSILPRAIRDTTRLRRIERTFVVRIERGPT